MGNTSDVKERLPGLQFTLKEATSGGKKTAAGTWRGTVALYCEYRDSSLWDAALKKLDGMKLFSTLAEEVSDALGAELDSTAAQLDEKIKENEQLQAQLEELAKENARLNGLLGSIGCALDDRDSRPDFEEKG